MFEWILLVSITAIVIWLHHWYSSRRYPNSPPGPLGVPILGSLLSIDAKSPHYSLTKMAKKYCKNGACQLFMGSIRTILLNDPRLIREAFTKEEFSGRAPLFFTHGIMKGYGIICSEGPFWKDQRKLVTSWLRSMGAAKMSSSREILEDKISKRLDDLEQILRSRSNVLEPVDPHAILSDSIGNLINGIVFGVYYRDGDMTWKWFTHIQEEGVKAMGVAAIVNFLPFLRFILPSVRKVMDRVLVAQEQTHSIYQSIINMRRNMKRRKAGNVVEDDNTKIPCRFYEVDKETKPDIFYFNIKDLIVLEDDCILDYYLDEQVLRQEKYPDWVMTEKLSDTQLLFLLADLFGAGLDTTLNTLLWFLLLVAKYPSEQVKIREELNSVCGSRAATFSDQPNLIYLRAAISETQRIRSVVPLGIPHGCVEDTKLGDYDIKKGTMVVPVQWALHMDDDIWVNSQEFKPSRFIGEEGSLLNPLHFIPFQTGKRMCPGDEFARLMLFMFASRLIHRYHLELEDANTSLEGVMGLTMAPVHYKIILRPIDK